MKTCGRCGEGVEVVRRYRWGRVARVIGNGASSLAFMLFATGIIFSLFPEGAAGMMRNTSPAEYARQCANLGTSPDSPESLKAVGALVLVEMRYALLCGLVLWLVGWFLLREKSRVYRCTNCGVSIEVLNRERPISLNPSPAPAGEAKSDLRP